MWRERVESPTGTITHQVVMILTQWSVHQFYLDQTQVKYLHVRYLGIVCDATIFVHKDASLLNFLKALEQSAVVTSQVIIIFY